MIKRVNYNNQVRDQFPVMSADNMHKLYKALKRFNDLAYDGDIMIKHKLKSGKYILQLHSHTSPFINLSSLET